MDTEERIAKLEARIEALQTKQAALHQQLTDAQIEQWQARIDDLEVQVHLGAMEANQKLAPLMDQLRNTWIEARAQLEDKAETASSVADTLRTGVENAYRELRKAVLETRNTISS
jgi:TolA-binding protein